MEKNPKKTELSPINKANKAKELVIEKENALHGIEGMMGQVTMLRRRIGEIDSELNSLLGLNIAPHADDTGRLTSFQSSIPKKGLVKDMAGVMSDRDPMTMKELVLILKEKEEAKKESERTDIMENSIRSYLTNLECFECIKKNDTRYSKKGWICHKDMLK